MHAVVFCNNKKRRRKKKRESVDFFFFFNGVNIYSWFCFLRHCMEYELLVKTFFKLLFVYISIDHHRHHLRSLLQCVLWMYWRCEGDCDEGFASHLEIKPEITTELLYRLTMTVRLWAVQVVMDFGLVSACASRLHLSVASVPLFFALICQGCNWEHGDNNYYHAFELLP